MEIQETPNSYSNRKQHKAGGVRILDIKSCYKALGIKQPCTGTKRDMQISGTE